MKYCLIGEKLGHSYSAEIHKAMGFDYSLKEIKKERLAEFLANNEYGGFNVTIPYKKEVLKYLDDVHQSVMQTGAVNTVKKVYGKLKGYNTDVGGMEYMIARKGLSLKDKHVLILGSGGTSNTAKALATKQGAKSVSVVSRSGDINYENCYDLTDAQIIINTTPVGMYPNVYAKPIELLGNFENLIAVFDCIYNPFRTQLIMQAKSRGLICSDGLPMLVRQALLSENIWKEQNPTDDITETLITDIRKQKANVVLFGMPSSGKTTFGKLVAKKLGRPFVDLDEYITERQGRSPAKIIQEDGESVFRQIESNAVSEIALNSGGVISLGGGTVLDDANVQKLRANGVMVYVKRNLSLLTTKNRPLSQKQGIVNLYNQRAEKYQNAKDVEINNDTDLNSAVKEIENVYKTACNKWC